MLYQELNKTLDFNPKLEFIYDTIESFINFAITNDLNYYISGGIGLMIYYKNIYRENDDIDISINLNEKNKWLDFFNENGLEFKEDVIDDFSKNQMKKFTLKDLNIDVILENLNKKPYNTVKIKNLDINVCPLLKTVRAKMSYTDFYKKTIREKDKIDFLYLTEYLQKKIN